MTKLTTDIADALQYFIGDAIRPNAPASEQMIGDAEQRLGLVFPPSMREFLQVHNGIGLIDHSILPVPALSVEEGIIEETLYCREMWDEDKWIAIARDSSGDVYVVLADRTDERGEHPVAQIDHETGNIMFIVASCYERFVWFLLDSLQREFEPNGESKDLWESADEDEDESEEPSFPWPYGDKEWMTQQDPHLARWLDDGDSRNSTESNQGIALPKKQLSMKEWHFDTRAVSVAFSPDGKRFAVGGNDGVVRLCSINEDKVQRTLAASGEAAGVATYGVTSVKFTKDGRSLLISGGVFESFGDLRLWGLETDTVLIVSKSYTSLCRANLFPSPEGSEYIVCTGGSLVNVWDSLLRDPLAEFVHGTEAIEAIATKDGSVIYSAGYDTKKGRDQGQVRVWDVAEGKCRRTLSSKNQGVYSLALSPDELILATGCSVKDQGYIEFWDTRTGELINRTCHTPSITFSMAFTPDGSKLFFCDWDGVRLYNIATDKVETVFVSAEPYSAAASTMDLSQDGLLLCGMNDYTVRLWKV